MNKKSIALFSLGVIIFLSYSFYLLHRISQTPRKPTDYQGVVMTLERTPCFGFCPAYKLTIYGDGKVVYVGNSYVGVKGEKSVTISPEQVKALIDAFYNANYFTLKDKYTERVTDLPTVYTSITINGKTKAVTDYYGAPKELKVLESKIDEIVHSSQWTSCSGETCDR